MSLQIGQKVEYTDDSGKTKQGVIHGVQRGDTGKGEVVLSYLVDTGKDTRVDEYRTDPRNTEMNKRINELVEKGTDLTDAVEKVQAQKDLPKSKVEVEKVRQPEQVQVAPDKVRAIK